MSNNKFTPGPWKIKQPAPLICAYTFDFDEMGLGFAIDGKESEANIALISAAPELLEALEEFLECEFSVANTETIKKALKAISKARGVM